MVNYLAASLTMTIKMPLDIANIPYEAKVPPDGNLVRDDEKHLLFPK